ncbi:MAG: esterase/lipase family protein [Acidiferrobacterales bacterium]
MSTISSCVVQGDIPHGKEESQQAECVILLHGLGRTRVSMLNLEAYLVESGYHTVNFGYPSRSEQIEKIASTRVPDAVSQCKLISSGKIHFVTHSLGGIIVRQYLQTNTLPKGSRIVMLSPPNQGSELSDRHKGDSWYQWYTGPAGQQLTTAKDSLPNRLKPINVEIGVIAGTKSIASWLSSQLPGEDDGVVSVKSTQLDEMKDFLLVPRTHTFIMESDEVQRQVVNFLRNGKFDHESKGQADESR